MKRISVILLFLVIACSPKDTEKQADQKDPSSNSVYFDMLQRATKYLQAGDFDKADSTLIQAEQIAPGLPMAYYMHGLLYFNVEKIERSSDYFIKALERCEGNELSEVISDINSLTSFPSSEKEDELIKSARESNPREAVPLLKQALEMNAMNATTYYLLGNAYAQTGKRSLAVDNLKKALSLNPVHEKAMKKLSALYKDDGNTTEYMKLIQRRIDYIGVTPQLRHEFAKIHIKQDNAAEAVLLLERNNTEFPGYYPSYYLLGKIYAGTGKHDRANKKLQVFKERDNGFFELEDDESAEFEEYRQKALRLIDNIR